MKILKFLTISILMIFSLNCSAQYNGNVETYDIKIKNVNLTVNSDHSLTINIPKVEGGKNTVRKVDIIEILDNCSEYCLNLNNKSEIVIRNNEFTARWPKTKGKYVVRVTVEQVTSEGLKKTFFEEKYFDII